MNKKLSWPTTIDKDLLEEHNKRTARIGAALREIKQMGGDNPFPLNVLRLEIEVIKELMEDQGLAEAHAVEIEAYKRLEPVVEGRIKKHKREARGYGPRKGGTRTVGNYIERLQYGPPRGFENTLAPKKPLFSQSTVGGGEK